MDIFSLAYEPLRCHLDTQTNVLYLGVIKGQSLRMPEVFKRMAIMKHIKTAIDALDDDDGTIVSGVKQLLPYEAPKLILLGAGQDTRGAKTTSGTREGASVGFSYDPS